MSKNLMLTIQIKTDDDTPITFFYTGVEQEGIDFFGSVRWRGQQYAKLFDKVEMDTLLSDPTKACHSEHYTRVVEKVDS